MTAPPPRETADHAELTRLAEADMHSSPVGTYRHDRVLALLSEIAALREERDEQEATKLAAYDRLSVEILDRDQAERQRDDMAAALRSIAEGNLGGEPWQANYETIKQVARNALANQGADQ